MNEQLQQALADILNKTMAGVEAGTAFLQAELPDVIQQLLMWKLASAALSTFFCLLYAYGFFLFMRQVHRHIKAKDGLFFDKYSPGGEVSLSGFLGMLIGGIGCIPASIIAMCSIGTALKIWLAPKIYLIEYAASLAK